MNAEDNRNDNGKAFQVCQTWKVSWGVVKWIRTQD